MVTSNYKWKMGQIFVAFSEYLNFTSAMIYDDYTPTKGQLKSE